ncbi:MAG: EamA family transporter RarD, partial [Alphaproteobacteria bacterium]
MLPAALAYLIWLEIVGRGHFLASGSSLTLNGLIILSGVVTVIPLAMFAFGARRIPLATIGLAQYITPSGQFLLAVFVFGETFDRARLVSFGLIWIALALYSWDLLVRRAPAKVTPAHST